MRIDVRSYKEIPSRRRKFLCGWLVALMAVTGSPCLSVAGEDIVWQSSSQLRDDPLDSEWSAFFPDNLSGNTVRVPSDSPVLPTVYGGVSASGKIQNNQVLIQGGNVDYASGGESGNGEVFFNRVTLDNGDAWELAGGFSDSGEVSSNKVTVNKGTALFVVGGESHAGRVTGNSVTIQGGRTGDVWGGMSETGEVSKNTVSISGGTAGELHNEVVGREVVGGWSRSGVVTGNSVTITGGRVGGTALSDRLRGGSSQGGMVHENKVLIEGGTVHAGIRGGQVYGGTGSATWNSVEITGGNIVSAGILGGYVEEGEGQAFGNKVDIRGGATVTLISGKGITGGLVEKGPGDASSNEVIIKGDAKVTASYVTGGLVYEGSGTAFGNTVTIEGVTLNSMVRGGVSDTGAALSNEVHITDAKGITAVQGGSSYSGGAGFNKVFITGSTVESVTGGFAGSGGKYSNSVEGNEVTLTDSTVTGAVIGGDGTRGNVVGNKVIVQGTVEKGPYGIKNFTSTVSSVTGGEAFLGDATNNQVAVSGVRVRNDLVGGKSKQGNASGNAIWVSHGTQVDGNISGGRVIHDTDGTSRSAMNSLNTLASSTAINEASGNSVYIQDATVKGAITGGMVQSASGGAAVNNTVTLLGTVNVQESDIRGGLVVGGGGDQFSGNTLVVATTGTARARSVANVEKFAFTLPANVKSNYVALEADAIAFGDGAGGESRVISIDAQGGHSALRNGDTVTLFRLSDGSLPDTSALQGLGGRVVPGSKGVTLLYNYEVADDGTAVVRNVRANPRAKALAEGFLSGAALVNQGGDMIAGQGMHSAMRESAQAGRISGLGIAPFAAIAGGTSRYDTGSHTDLDSFSLIAGLSFSKTLAPGDLTLGAFFEYGYGSYDSHNGFGNAAPVNGGGDTHYTGGGILGRMDFIPTGPGHFHVEASGRIGQLKTDFSSGDLRDSLGRKADYDISSQYYGLHLGLGYDWKLTEKTSLDLYGKYFWTHVEGDSFTLSTGDPVHFKDVDSHRLRGGTRLSIAVTDSCKPYIGAAWEYELDGKADASSYGYSIDAPELKGSTGIGELGLTLTPATSLPLSLDLAVQGYTGVREGVSGGLQFRLEF